MQNHKYTSALNWSKNASEKKQRHEELRENVHYCCCCCCTSNAYTVNLCSLQSPHCIWTPRSLSTRRSLPFVCVFLFEFRPKNMCVLNAAVFTCSSFSFCAPADGWVRCALLFIYILFVWSSNAPGIFVVHFVLLFCRQLVTTLFCFCPAAL